MNQKEIHPTALTVFMISQKPVLNVPVKIIYSKQKVLRSQAKQNIKSGFTSKRSESVGRSFGSADAAITLKDKLIAITNIIQGD